MRTNLVHEESQHGKLNEAGSSPTAIIAPLKARRAAGKIDTGEFEPQVFS
jgi:hypothetical protein